MNCLLFSPWPLYLLLPDLSRVLFEWSSVLGLLYWLLCWLSSQWIWWGAPVCGQVMIEWCSFHWQIKGHDGAGRNLYEWRNPSVSGATAVLLYSLIVKVLGERFASMHHELFLVLQLADRWLILFCSEVHPFPQSWSLNWPTCTNPRPQSRTGRRTNQCNELVWCFFWLSSIIFFSL